MKYTWFIIGLGFLILWGCAPSTVKKAPRKPLPPAEYSIPNDSGKTKIVLKTENVRETPNGEKIGTIRKGERVTVLRRIGNWVEFDSRNFVEAYIWAPSLGYPYINLYAATVYYDTTRQQFKPLSYLQALFAQKGTIVEQSPKEKVIFFTDIGLGSHTETEVEVVQATQKEVKHGVTVYVAPETGTIRKVKIDFYKPLTGVKTALAKCGLPYHKPDEETDSHVRWNPGTLVPGLAVILERQEWKSNRFTAVIYEHTP